MDEETVQTEQVEAVEPEEKPLFTPEELHNIRSIKLTNGDDVVGSIQAISNHIMVLRRPSKIVRIAHDDGTVAILLVKWHVFSSEETCIVQMSSVVSYCKVTEEMKEYYLKSVVQQITEETEATKKDSGEYKWPEWMDSIDPSRLN